MHAAKYRNELSNLILLDFNVLKDLKIIAEHEYYNISYTDWAFSLGGDTRGTYSIKIQSQNIGSCSYNCTVQRAWPSLFEFS